MDRNIQTLSCKSQSKVVPYVGTWIEISLAGTYDYSERVVPYVGTWIEMRTEDGHIIASRCRSLRGNVDRNIFRKTSMLQMWCVVPYVGTWIEMLAGTVTALRSSGSFPTWERG